MAAFLCNPPFLFLIFDKNIISTIPIFVHIFFVEYYFFLHICVTIFLYDNNTILNTPDAGGRNTGLRTRRN
ncbi:hypothetical protein D7Y09_11285 [bacterium 1XD42-1]|nr:hypothetical protein D7X25_09595 [bacterium 1XD42-8]RKJ63409.1 hypothetical protein D7Y09_11285 [bacterium 1XD42-1]